MAMTLKEAIAVMNPEPKSYEAIKAWEMIRAHITQPAQAVDARAEAYAERLARALWAKHYAEDAPQWEPLTGDLLGLLSQIDNMATGLTTRALAGEKAEGWRDGKARAMALHAAVGAIYFADSSDYLSALWEVVSELAPDLVDELEANPSAAWHRTMAETDPFTLPTPPTDGEE